jgi:hypothetical protein
MVKVEPRCALGYVKYCGSCMMFQVCVRVRMCVWWACRAFAGLRGLRGWGLRGRGLRGCGCCGGAGAGVVGRGCCGRRQPDSQPTCGRPWPPPAPLQAMPAAAAFLTRALQQCEAAGDDFHRLQLHYMAAVCMLLGGSGAK